MSIRHKDDNETLFRKKQGTGLLRTNELVVDVLRGQNIQDNTRMSGIQNANGKLEQNIETIVMDTSIHSFWYGKDPVSAGSTAALDVNVPYNLDAYILTENIEIYKILYYISGIGIDNDYFTVTHHKIDTGGVSTTYTLLTVAAPNPGARAKSMRTWEGSRIIQIQKGFSSSEKESFYWGDINYLFVSYTAGASSTVDTCMVRVDYRIL